jgi:hypothetical protein|tara:strand:+ start:4244 stop:5116 length:873 start_codon:yes stop_codon:yes gene_type:complete
MRLIFSTILVIFTLLSFAHTRQYNGQLDKYNISLSTFSYSNGHVQGIYLYNKFDTPIIINGKLEGNKLTLIEKNNSGGNTATLIFNNYDPNSEILIGKWIATKGDKQFKITLTKTFDFDSYDNSSFKQRELLQSASTKNHYFKLFLSKTTSKETRVTGINIYQKRTDNLIQYLKLDCQYMGLSNISIGDFNFDGLIDFSVFESSYAGSNTSSLYILRNVNSPTYFISEFSGVSLEFDDFTKTILENNQCCGGRSHIKKSYKIIDNKMVLIEQHCFEYDEVINGLVAVKCK